MGTGSKEGAPRGVIPARAFHAPGILRGPAICARGALEAAPREAGPAIKLTDLPVFGPTAQQAHVRGRGKPREARALAAKHPRVSPVLSTQCLLTSRRRTPGWDETAVSRA